MNTLKISYFTALTCLALQFILLGIASFDRPNIVINGPFDIFIGLLVTLFYGIPWLTLIPGLLMKTKNIMAWMSYVCLVYFIVWVLSAFGAQQSGLATLGVFITLIQFIASNLYTRLIKRQ